MLMTKQEKHKSKLITVKEVANYLVVTERTVYRLIKDPTFPAFKVGGQWRFESRILSGRRRITGRVRTSRELIRQGFRYAWFGGTCHMPAVEPHDSRRPRMHAGPAPASEDRKRHTGCVLVPPA